MPISAERSPAYLVARFGLVAFLVERQPDDKSVSLERAGAVEDLTDRRAFADAAGDVAGWRRNRPGRIAYCEADSFISEIDREEAHHCNGRWTMEVGRRNTRRARS